MKTLNKDLKHKIEVWISPLPDSLQELVWEALRATENTDASFNPHANDFSELLMWHLSPAGRFYWSSVNQLTEYFWNRQLNGFKAPMRKERLETHEQGMVA